MATVIDPPRVPRVPITTPSAPTVPLGTSAAANASIDAYLGAGDGMALIMGLTLKVCGTLIVLIALAWAIGLLPGAVKLF